MPIFYGNIIMQANFLLKRELNKNLVCAVVRSPNFIHHFHSHIELYLIKSGEIEIMINDNKKVLGAGEISVALSYDAHSYRTVDSSEAIYLIIPLEYCGEFLPLLSSKHLPSPFIKDEKTYKTVLSALEGILDGGNEITRRGHIYSILGAILDHMSDSKLTTAATDAFSPDILIYLSNNFKNELTLESVAKEFGFNPSYLSRSFRETFGISFIKYLNMLRLREAVILLQSGKMSVTECVYESGFGSMRSFYRVFHDEFGCTPKEYFEKEQKSSAK